MMSAVLKLSFESIAAFSIFVERNLAVN